MVADQAGISERGFGQGVTIGDYNSDGFPDVYVANIGGNTLWRNNGDGTFTNVTDTANLKSDEWTTSCVMADLNQDGLCDIYDVNYLTGSDIFDRVCKHANGSPALCMPFDFDGQPDRLWINQGNGQFHDATKELLSTVPNGKGLGIAVWDATGNGELSWVVANDTTPNFFFSPEKSPNDVVTFRERGILSGLAYNSDGKAEGSMGIALGDANQDGLTDLLMTNFLNESNTLYLGSPNEYFTDATRDYNLEDSSIPVLGFGTQFVDLDLDGVEELFVSNGHIDDLRKYGKPYRMRPQVLLSTEGKFTSLDGDNLGEYFQSEWLGRSVARLDWNRDGRDDLIVGHLDTPTAL
ncbi:MAG TPA: VCBS repeat-containing protein, partial [Phycisphaerales bacterium]|nr:VCBS repeat-containing protein [Phycisphaerales bacterium]